jgi:thioredoxin reductase
MHDVIIIGAGVAGLSPALILGRARRDVLVLEAGPPRNAPAAASHGFLTRDNESPLELLRLAKRDLESYPNVRVREGEAMSAAATDEGFVVELQGGETDRSRKLVLAYGMVDELPGIPGLRELWGSHVHHCPFCHGWELRDEPIGILGASLLEMRVPLLRGWSTNITVLTGGETISDDVGSQLQAFDVAVCEAPIERLAPVESPASKLLVEFDGAPPVELAGIYVVPQQRLRTAIAEQLGCDHVEVGPTNTRVIVTDDRVGETTIPGVYAAGDITTGQHALPLAVASGARVAYGLAHALSTEDAARYLGERAVGAARP